MSKLKSIIIRFNHTTKLITCPIFYVNSAPHIGHLYTAVIGDTLTRYEKFKSFKTAFSIGTDEHGLKIQMSAKGTTIDHCNQVSLKFRSLFQAANVEYSDFVRTTEDRHRVAVQAFWMKLYDAGFIYKGHHEGWYSVSDECFVPQSQITVLRRNGVETSVSKESGKVVEWMKEENYKFRLSLFKDRLLLWLKENPDAIMPPSRLKDLLNELNSSDLQDLSVSRLKSKVGWGITLPNDKCHVIYVWLDALVNYLTVSGYPSDMSERWPASIQIIGKDILKFHAIYWPAFLMAAGLPLPKRILAHGHWLISNQKMSKSTGNGVDPYGILSKFGIDPIRYFLIRDGGMAIDPEFTIDTIQRRYKHDLAGQLGNLMMRISSLKINPSYLIPDTLGSSVLSVEEAAILKKFTILRDVFDNLFQKYDLANALAATTDLISDLNGYWSQTKPWTLPAEQLQTSLYLSFESVRICGLLLQCVMPDKMAALLDAMSVPRNERTYHHAIIDGCSIKARRVLPLEPLFPKLEILAKIK